MNIYFGLSEDITVGVELTTLTKVVVATTAAEYIAVYKTFVQFHTGMSGLINTLQGSYRVLFTRGNDNATSDGSNLTTTKEGVAHMTAVHRYIRFINTTVINVTTAKDVTTILQAIGAITRPCLIV